MPKDLGRTERVERAPEASTQRGTSLRGDVVRLVRERRYEEALALLYQARGEDPQNRELQASILQIKEFLIGAYAKKLGGLDRVAGPVPVAAGRSPEALLVVRYVDGTATFDDVARTCPLGRLRTLQILVSLYRGAESESARDGAGAGSGRLRRAEADDAALDVPDAMVAAVATEPPPPTLRAQDEGDRVSEVVSLELTSEPPPATMERTVGAPVVAPEDGYRAAFARGTTAYVQRRFDDAAAAFEECQRLRPDDPGSAVMLRRALRDASR